MSIKSTLNQLRFDPALRIPAIGRIDVPTMTVIEYLMRPAQEQGALDASNASDEPESSESLGLLPDRGSVNQFATSIWRLGRQLEKLEEKGPGRVAKKRHKDLLEQLEKKGLVIKDFTGESWSGEEFEKVNGEYGPDENPEIYSMTEPRVIFGGEITQLGIITVQGKSAQQ